MMAIDTVPFDLGEIVEDLRGEVVQIWVGGDLSDVTELVKASTAWLRGLRLGQNRIHWAQEAVKWICSVWNITPERAAVLILALGSAGFRDAMIQTGAIGAAYWQKVGESARFAGLLGSTGPKGDA
ncbi:MAG TPA: hypothetical protein VM366_04160 [Anaerolineae bacterium]|nr:hypothetical protein [Anaerolineae bacterium]